MSVAKRLAQARAEAAKHGATVEEDNGAYQAVAPDGFHWVESDSYHLAMPYRHDDRAASRIAALRDGIERIKSGTRAMTPADYELAGEEQPS